MSPQTANSRAYVCDPRCVEPLGGDVSFLKYVTQSLGKYFAEVVPLCSKFLPAAVVEEYGFTPFFDFYYDEFLKIKRPAGSDRPLSNNRPTGAYVDPIEAVATADAIRLIDTFDIGSDDTMFFPGADFYGVCGLLNALSQPGVARRPRIFLRFMGISENGTTTYRAPLVELAKRFAVARAAGLALEFSAETPKYADHLATLFNAPVAVSPYVNLLPAEPMPQDGPFVCFCGGGARLDKGFLHLWDLFRDVRMKDPDLTIRFVAQSLPDRAAADRQHYISQLYALPGVELLPSWISEAEILEQFRNCHAVVLPYDRQTYAFRGSAVMMAAACCGRLAVTLTRTAFAPQVEYYNLGSVVKDIPAMADAIREMAREPRRQLAARALQARYRFVNDVMNTFDQWFGGGA